MAEIINNDMIKIVRQFMKEYPQMIKCPICATDEFLQMTSLNDYYNPGVISFLCLNPNCLHGLNNNAVSFAMASVTSMMGILQKNSHKFNEIINCEIELQRDGKYQAVVNKRVDLESKKQNESLRKE